ncbi:uncharacterized protein LOC112344963 isoform X2 [Selaginella moellendorffii]|uniref:uncharacterized protein LOC112344963 isoform X2 n=1 Tax=Selaginella moellendorffii TaxID=88036 RepID=UPI000D1D0087|nr:uncharacterized protein LOC112344963 isoform X2 [Selaginella moellendorffii]|eukprot:XP_024526469.1 uncharacterized protein LOC112344963 isoform X2 [Selaginella moellendorffii]
MATISGNAASMALARRLVSPPQALRSSSSLSRSNLAAKSSPCVILRANAAAANTEGSKLRQISSLDSMIWRARNGNGAVLRMSTPTVLSLQGHVVHSFLKSGVT